MNVNVCVFVCEYYVYLLCIYICYNEMLKLTSLEESGQHRVTHGVLGKDTIRNTVRYHHLFDAQFKGSPLEYKMFGNDLM